MQVESQYIHIQWEGPYSYSEASKLRDPCTDFGVYQIYGSHPVYGSDVLLYIGKAERQAFGVRLAQELWNDYNQDSSRLQFYVGRISGYGETPEDESWVEQISQAERLLICSHWPAGNSSGLNVKFGEDHHHIHVLNWGKHRDLLPEVSGARFSSRFESSDGYKQFGESRR